MDRDLIKIQLTRTERLVANTQQTIDKMRDEIASLEKNGEDASAAQGFLESLERLQVGYLEDCDRLRNELKQAGQGS